LRKRWLFFGILLPSKLGDRRDAPEANRPCPRSTERSESSARNFRPSSQICFTIKLPKIKASANLKLLLLCFNSKTKRQATELKEIWSTLTIDIQTKGNARAKKSSIQYFQIWIRTTAVFPKVPFLVRNNYLFGPGEKK